eukprot:TRINITY_DN11247_c0_g1_i1.p1 TRINITY_DN11247_c0_g1~~TRINITY_DN11247_c0_g1_i1.p1  ORF type:complete len:357 (+),score=64.40 TRINITY_DN11247_c0_g1_i1:40-1071(+)
MAPKGTRDLPFWLAGSWVAVAVFTRPAAALNANAALLDGSLAAAASGGQHEALSIAKHPHVLGTVSASAGDADANRSSQDAAAALFSLAKNATVLLTVEDSARADSNASESVAVVEASGLAQPRDAKTGMTDGQAQGRVVLARVVEASGAAAAAGEAAEGATAVDDSVSRLAAADNVLSDSNQSAHAGPEPATAALEQSDVVAVQSKQAASSNGGVAAVERSCSGSRSTARQLMHLVAFVFRSDSETQLCGSFIDFILLVLGILTVLFLVLGGTVTGLRNDPIGALTGTAEQVYHDPKGTLEKVGGAADGHAPPDEKATVRAFDLPKTQQPQAAPPHRHFTCC